MMHTPESARSSLLPGSCSGGTRHACSARPACGRGAHPCGEAERGERGLSGGQVLWVGGVLSTAGTAGTAGTAAAAAAATAALSSTPFVAAAFSAASFSTACFC